MQGPITFESLIKNAYQQALDRGHWSEPGDELPAQLRMLIVTEIAEATACLRADEPTLIHYGEVSIDEMVRLAEVGETVYIAPESAGKIRHWLTGPHPHGHVKPQGEPIEMADILLRCGSWLGRLKVEPDRFVPYAHPLFRADEAGRRHSLIEMTVEYESRVRGACETYENELSRRPVEWHAEMVRALMSRPQDVFAMADLVRTVLQYCAIRRIDIEQAIRVKAAYNATRPIRHGKVF